MITKEVLSNLTHAEEAVILKFFSLTKLLKQNNNSIASIKARYESVVQEYEAELKKFQEENEKIQSQLDELFPQPSTHCFDSLFDRPDYPLTYDELKEWTRLKGKEFKRCQEILSDIYSKVTIEQLAAIIKKAYPQFNGKKYAPLSVYTYLSDIRKVMLDNNFSDKTSSDTFVAFFFENLDDILNLVF